MSTKEVILEVFFFFLVLAIVAGLNWFFATHANELPPLPPGYVPRNGM